jgi:hypothetical protein
MLNDVVLILGTDVSIETHMKSDKLTINFEKKKKKSDKLAYLKFVQNLRIIFLKLKTQRLNSNWINI